MTWHVVSLAAALFAQPVEGPAPLHCWRLTAEHVKGATLAPVAGPIAGTLRGPVRFAADGPRALVFDGNSKAKHCVHLTDDIAKAGLPARDLSVEAWVRVDKAADWGGILGAFQDNGP